MTAKIYTMPFPGRQVTTFEVNRRRLAYFVIDPQSGEDEIRKLFKKAEIAFDSWEEWPADAAIRDPDLTHMDYCFGPGYWSRKRDGDPEKGGPRLVIIEGYLIEGRRMKDKGCLLVMEDNPGLKDMQKILKKKNKENVLIASEEDEPKKPSVLTKVEISPGRRNGLKEIGEVNEQRKI